jgi:predicted DNA-binding transcriptional regulator YafY
MAESGVRSGRLLSIVLLLQTKGAATARQIAEHLEVSVRTVYRDVDVLSRIGVPIYAETGRAGGYRLVDGYRTSLTGLTGPESLALFLIGLPAPAASLGLTDQARAAETKLLAALSPAHREQAGRLRNRFLLDLPAWYQNAESPVVLPCLAEAALANRRVQMRYRRWTEPRTVHRQLDPYGLVVKNGIWYLVAAASSAQSRIRTYRVSNILDLQPTVETFERRPNFDLEQFWRRHLADFDRRRLTDTARIRISPSLLPRLEDLGDFALRAACVATGEVDEAGWTIVDLPIESAGHAATQLIRYGGDVEVLAPAAMRSAMQSIAQSVLVRHRPRAPR